jgi:hypothetical protein
MPLNLKKLIFDRYYLSRKAYEHELEEKTKHQKYINTELEYKKHISKLKSTDK